MFKGKIKWYDETKGYGFIKTDNGEDVFLHRTGLIDSNLMLQEDQQVEFEVRQGDKGMVAYDVKAF
ncbi:MAG: cold shock domain-containing protein [Bacteroidales bacterium]|nr:cold shock domain-containing protein [Bacteroidales bacterium]